MKKLTFFIIVAIVAVWSWVAMGRASMQPNAGVRAAQDQHTPTEYATPTFIPTHTPVPTATVGYEATIMVAQATADEARRVNAQATAQHESYLLAQMQLTADAESRHYEMLSWTVTAGPTVIPLTATQQAAANTQMANNQNLLAAQITATHAAPTQYAAMVQIQDSMRYAAVDRFVRMGFLCVIGLFLLSMVWFMRRYAPPAPKPDAPMPTEIVVQIRHNNGQGTFSQQRLVIPCAPDQLTELAEMAANGEKKFGINRLESSSRTFRNQRATLIAVRQFLIDNGFVITDANGTITLNAAGEEFLASWFDVHKLPDEYEFAPENEPESQNQVVNSGLAVL
jgi:hypothetical protein